jgi:hypothetical protein
MMAVGCNWVAHSMLTRFSTAVTLATILSPPVCVCDRRLLHTGDIRRDHHQMKPCQTRNLQLNFMPFGSCPVLVMKGVEALRMSVWAWRDR